MSDADTIVNCKCAILISVVGMAGCNEVSEVVVPSSTYKPPDAIYKVIPLAIGNTWENLSIGCGEGHCYANTEWRTIVRIVSYSGREYFVLRDFYKSSVDSLSFEGVDDTSYFRYDQKDLLHYHEPRLN